MIDKYLLNEYINNASDIYNLTLSDNFKSLIDFNFKEKIYIKSTLIYRKDYISYIENFIYNIDEYISFLKHELNINSLEIRYITFLTIFNNKKIFTRKEYYYDNPNYYIKSFKKILLNKYTKNYNILKNFNPGLIKYDYDRLIKIINNNKRANILFEDVTNNINYYSELWNQLKIDV